METTTRTRQFATLTTKPAVDQDDLGPYRVLTCGHDDASCSAIAPTSRIAGHDLSLVDYLVANEWFDGEIVYADPIACRVCAR